MTGKVVTKLDEALTPIDIGVVEPCDPSTPSARDLVEVGEMVGPDRGKLHELPDEQECDPQPQLPPDRRQSCAETTDEDIQEREARDQIADADGVGEEDNGGEHG